MATWAQVNGSGAKENREKDDFYPTPPEGTAPLLAVERFDGPIWEPACGEGHMSQVLEAAGHTVISTDLVHRGYGEGGVDFLMEWQARAPNIVTNPPFKMAEDFVRKALDLASHKVCILARLQLLEGRQRKALFETTPLARVWVFSKRLTMTAGSVTSQSGGMLQFAWFVWEHGYAGRPQLGWL